ncbi:sensor histidine kinase [Leeuwenhoekiella parthenopeia]|uniref:Histidine kinase n=1 Tax=Leeuwenhoekiella parthenopeia TaxID=2890320 RepID=A0ABS8GPV3_9FLAO|nr:sensor histidine kinase [Leeuwenhoekiella parthenopeia]MCC4212012.1 histidine kinase [Leeuwenhoekiella parthenopeia]
MKNLLHILSANRYFLLFILLFAYFQSIYTRIVGRGVVDAYIFTPEAAFATLISVSILFVIMLFFIRKRHKSVVLGVREMFKIFSLSLLAFLIAMHLIGFVIAFSFDTIERNFNQETLTLSTFSNLLDGIIYGSFFLTYYYHKQNRTKQEQLMSYHKAISESKINQLKTQLNPHFLFNNLNVLDQLIEEDKNKASDFLNEFAEMYRYVLQVSDQKFISLSEELIFAKNYFELIKHKYGDAYQLQIENHKSDGYIVPLTLQLLIENAIQHNLGTVKKPIKIQITIDENIRVINTYMPKRNAKLTSGRALNNLKEQYELLTKTPISIEQTNSMFSVKLPVIKTLDPW